jgi:magnesium chelatase family protein
MLALAHSAALQGIDAKLVQVEVNTGETGEPKIILVGLPDTAVKESTNRVSSALANSGFQTHRTHTTVNLAPGDLRKEGPIFDLPIALAFLVASNQRKCTKLQDYLVAGELSLSGEVRPVRGALAMAILARAKGLKGVLLPPESAEEAVLVESCPVIPVRTLAQAAAFLEGSLEIPPMDPAASAFRQPPRNDYRVDFADIKGQQAVRRAVEIAVAGSHNLLMIGPPGSGKSMIAKRIPTIMPEPTQEEFLEILSIHSAAGITLDPAERAFQRPFRAPHHTISDVGLLGGGSIPGPGEISLAHHGVLFLDELPEFRRSTLEVLRQPLEDGEVTISRSAGKVTLPCSFMLIAAMNPTPGGFGLDDERSQVNTPAQIQRYRSKISGPLLDRIDIHIEAPALSISELRHARPGESSAAMRQRILAARAIQQERFVETPVSGNARMAPHAIRKHCQLSKEQGDLLEHAMNELDLSARAYDRILKVARTIADLAGSPQIESPNLLEAIQYRSLDRKLFF